MDEKDTPKPKVEELSSKSKTKTKTQDLHSTDLTKLSGKKFKSDKTIENLSKKSPAVSPSPHIFSTE